MSQIKEDAAGFNALQEKAQNFLKQGYLREAQEAFDEVLKLSPDSVVDLVCRGMASFKLKQWKKSEADFLKAKTLDSGDTEAWLGYGMSLAVQQKIQPALDTLETMLEAHPSFVRGHIQTARLYYQLCTTNKGKQHIDSALAGYPGPDERREIQQILEEQSKLDNKRMQRPDFEALRRNKSKQASA